MTGYTILEREHVPEVLKNKPRWLACALVAVTMMAITSSAVAAGAFIGYTYCYLEHRHEIATGNLTQSTNFQIVQVPYITGLKELRKNRTTTINNGLSSVLVSRILKIGHALLDEEMVNMPWVTEVPGFVQRMA